MRGNRVGHGQDELDLELQQPRPGAGHNIQGAALAIPDAAALAAAWADEHAALLTRRDQLLDALSRFEAAHGGGIESEDIAGRAADFARLLAREAEKAESIRKRVKAPLLAASRALDRFFKTDLSDRLAAAAAKVETLLGAWQRAKVAAERELRQAAAEAARETADRLAAEAMRSGGGELLQQARSAGDAAQRAEMRLHSTVDEMGHASGEGGAVARLKSNWTYEVVDFEQVPREWLMVDDRKVRLAIREEEGLRDIPGLRIYDDPRTVVR
jgi:hypothetical protein